MIRAMRPLALFLTVAVLAMAWAVLSPSARATGPTYVAGESSGDWTIEGSPYIVLRDVLVAERTTLNITAGVEVRFDPGTALRVRGDLNVAGSDTGPIVFTSNGSATPWSWEGIVVYGRASIRRASISFAFTGVDVEHGSAVIDLTAASDSAQGLRVNGTAVSVSRSTFSRNTGTGLTAVSSTVFMSRTDFNSNGAGLYLIGSTVTLENGTISGFAADAELNTSTLTLLNTTTSHQYSLGDTDSSVEERWFAHVLVRDAHATPVPSASVSVSGGGLPVPLTLATDADGWVRWINLHGATKYRDYWLHSGYTFTASSRGSSVVQTLSPSGDSHLEIALPADVTDPVANAGPDLTIPEDTAVSFDGTRSADNDPAFPAGASFTWRFDDGGAPIVLSGPTVTYTFPTPGVYAITLDVTDAAGNDGLDLILVTVQDRTPPVAKITVPKEVFTDEAIVLDASPSTDNDPLFADTGNFTWTLESGGRTVIVFGRTPSFSSWWGHGEYAITLRVRDAGGNEAVAQDSILLRTRPSLDLAWLAAALVAWFAALGIAGTERGRMAFFSWFVIPLYTRMKKDEVLDQFTRGQIYGYIVVHPGDSYIDIKRNLQLNNGTLTHHLNVLERDGLVRSKNVVTRKRFFAAGARVPEDGGGMHEVQQQIMRHLKESGGLAVNDVAGVIGISRQLAIYHLRDLSRQGFVRIERRAFRIVAYAEDPGPPPSP